MSPSPRWRWLRRRQAFAPPARCGRPPGRNPPMSFAPGPRRSPGIERQTDTSGSPPAEPGCSLAERSSRGSDRSPHRLKYSWLHRQFQRTRSSKDCGGRYPSWLLGPPNLCRVKLLLAVCFERVTRIFARPVVSSRDVRFERRLEGSCGDPEVRREASETGVANHHHASMKLSRTGNFCKRELVWTGAG